MIALGDLVSVPFNVACGRCRTCRETNTGVCLTVNPGSPPVAPMAMWTWATGSADRPATSWSPYADFNLLKFPDKNQAMSKIMDLTMLTGPSCRPASHGALNGGRQAGARRSTSPAPVPVGLAGGPPPPGLLGAAVIMIGDMNEARLSHARSVGFVPIDLTKTRSALASRWAAVVGEPTVDSVIDAVGFRSQGPWRWAISQRIVLNQAMEIIRPGLAPIGHTGIVRY